MVISQRKAIQKKLMAATSMLLVACIMLISASYAWFTLSTAPEITGITTNVGANGNLEIALAKESTWTGNEIPETSTNSGDVVKLSNVTWGNLISLEDTFYGLNGVTLMPTRLNGTGLKVNPFAPLQYAKYGSDGRVKDLVAALYAINTNTTGDAPVYTVMDGAAGVRVIGSADAMTERESLYRSTKGAFTVNATNATGTAVSALQDYGSVLAGIAVEYGLDNKTTGYSQSQMKAIGTVLTEMAKVSEKLTTAWENAVLAYAASAKGEGVTGLTTEEGFLAFKEKFLADNGYTYSSGIVTVTYTLDDADTTVALALPTSLADFKTQSDSIASDIASAQDEYDATYDAAEGTEYTWDELYGVLTYLVNIDGVQVNGFGITEAKESKDKVMQAVMNAGGIEVQLAAGSGVFYDLAALCGNYSAQIQVEIFGMDNMLATMKTVATDIKANEVAQTLNVAGAPVKAGAANNVLSDAYAYQIDFLLRTNASGADLLLQQDAVDRIYKDSTNEETMGGGSRMTFTGSVGFDTDKMVSLMDAIRVVFMTKTGEIKGVAVLDTANATIDVNAITVDAELKLVNATLATDGKLVINGDKADQVLIEGMAANIPVKLSALVYLDGDAVTNADVANAATSMTGALNLQFASSATLVPMENTALKGEAVESTETGAEVTP